MLNQYQIKIESYLLFVLFYTVLSIRLPVVYTFQKTSLSFVGHRGGNISTMSKKPSSFITIQESQQSIRTTDEEQQQQETTTINNMKFVRGCRDLITKYDVFLLDMWGVMHDGTIPYAGVIDVVEKLYQAGKKLIILSNSSKRQIHSIKNLVKLGFEPTYFESVITSGEVAYQMLHQQSSVTSSEQSDNSMINGDWYKPWAGLTKRYGDSNNNKNTNTVFILGSGDEDIEYCAEAGWSVGPLNDAAIIIARGTFTIVDGATVNVDKNKDPELYETTLQQVLSQAAALRIPLLICNPDKIRPDADRSPMPGRIGVMYEEELTKAGETNPTSLIKSIGKPFDDVYEIALRHVESATGGIDRSRVCMVGDALETDVTGGSKFGIDTVWVINDGVYKPEVEAAFSDNNNNQDNDEKVLVNTATTILNNFNKLDGTYAEGRILSPTYLLPHFRW